MNDSHDNARTDREAKVKAEARLKAMGKRQPAYYTLDSDDQHLRGTAEYICGIAEYLKHTAGRDFTIQEYHARTITLRTLKSRVVQP